MQPFSLSSAETTSHNDDTQAAKRVRERDGEKDSQGKGGGSLLAPIYEATMREKNAWILDARIP